MSLGFGALPGYGLLVQSQPLLDFFAEARVIHRMLILVTPINQNNCFYSTPKVVKLKLDNCNFIASVVIIIISTIYYNMLVRWG